LVAATWREHHYHVAETTVAADTNQSFFYSVSKRNSRGIAGMFGLYSVNGYAPAKGQGFHLYEGQLEKVKPSMFA
jgi:hypothetical protein